MLILKKGRFKTIKQVSMNKIGIFFGTDTGSTRLVAEKIYNALGEGIADQPKNVNQTRVSEFLLYDAYILGLPSYGIGDLPGIQTGCMEANWAEFLYKLDDVDLTGRRAALFGLGNQQRYADRFASSMIKLYHRVYGLGADIVGSWSTEGYQFIHSDAVVDGRFVGLALDHRNQSHLTDERVNTWLAEVTPRLLPDTAAAA